MKPTDSSETDRRRRAKLESLKSDVPAGPLSGGVRATDQILVASFYNRRNCQRFCSTLSTAGISSATKSSRIKISVFVSNADRRRAFELLDDHQRAHPDKRPTGIRRDFDATILSILFGISGALLFLLTPGDSLVRVVSSIGWMVSSLCVGMLADRCQRNYYYYGRLQFSMAEFLGFTAITAALVAFWKIMIAFY